MIGFFVGNMGCGLLTLCTYTYFITLYFHFDRQSPCFSVCTAHTVLLILRPLHVLCVVHICAKQCLFMTILSII